MAFAQKVTLAKTTFAFATQDGNPRLAMLACLIGSAPTRLPMLAMSLMSAFVRPTPTIRRACAPT